MRNKIAKLMFGFLLVGIGSVLFVFEMADFRYEDGTNLSLGDSTSTITNTYSLDNIDQIDTNGATIVIDEDQVGVKVDIAYNSDVTDVQARTYTIITDCSTEENVLCQTLDKDKITTLVITYDHIESRFNPKALFDLMIDQAKDKVILNVFNLTIPKVTVTVSSENLNKIH